MAEFKHQMPIEASLEKVYSASCDASWPAELVEGGCQRRREGRPKAEFGFDKKAIVFGMKMEKLEPGKTVAWRCHGDQLEWNGTTLTWAWRRMIKAVRFTHSRWKALTEMYAICSSSWGALMYRLKNYAEGRNPGPHWTE